MGTHFDPLYHAIVDGLDRATVRPVYNHGSATKLREDQSSLRLVCIGDAQRNIGLGGGATWHSKMQSISPKPCVYRASSKPSLTTRQEVKTIKK